MYCYKHIKLNRLTPREKVPLEMAELKKIPCLLRKPNPNYLAVLHFTSSYVN